MKTTQEFTAQITVPGQSRVTIFSSALAGGSGYKITAVSDVSVEDAKVLLTEFVEKIRAILLYSTEHQA